MHGGSADASVHVRLPCLRPAPGWCERTHARAWASAHARACASIAPLAQGASSMGSPGDVPGRVSAIPVLCRGW
eukprot:9728960-Alexandrium_andersonii.AAC.1